MLRVEVRFPLGVYHALSSQSFADPEWPPSPVRLIGALLAAAHENDHIDTEEARTALLRLCTAAPPTLAAPSARPIADGSVDGISTVAKLRGASRWAPRNHGASELAKSGVSPRNIGRERTEVNKGGVAVGEQVVSFHWADVTLDRGGAAVLAATAQEVTFLGTSRSPVLVRVPTGEHLEADDRRTWEPVDDTGDLRGQEVVVRIPTPSLLDDFDARHDARRAPPRKALAPAEHVPARGMGAIVAYARRAERLARRAEQVLDPEHWGDMIVLELDSDGSELRPRAAANYLVARAFREALLGAYDSAGSAGEAPPVLRGHGDEPHAAIVPLPFVWGSSAGHGGDGAVRGIGVVLPHERRLPDVAEQRLRVEAGLLAFVTGDTRRWVDVPGAGRLRLRLPAPGRPLLRTLEEARYRRPSRSWETVVPVVHARRRTSSGPRGVERQVAVDCAHVGLPAPARIEVVDHPGLGGAPARLLADRTVPGEWRASLSGPRSHLRLTFERPVAGPILLGRARHFGTGLCVPSEHA